MWNLEDTRAAKQAFIIGVFSTLGTVCATILVGMLSSRLDGAEKEDTWG